MDSNVADEIALTWEAENVPNEDFLYMRVHKGFFHPRHIPFAPAIFKNNGEGMSTDWSKYSTPNDTRNRVKQFGKMPENYAVIEMLVADVKSIENQTVEHTPDIPNLNRAHTDVFGEKDEEVRLKFSRIAQNIVIKLEDPIQ